MAACGVDRLADLLPYRVCAKRGRPLANVAGIVVTLRFLHNPTVPFTNNQAVRPNETRA
jgi:hypothetical protein